MKTPEQAASYQREYRKKNADTIRKKRRHYERRRDIKDPAFRASRLERERIRRADKQTWASHTLGAIRHRAKTLGLPFNLTVEDLVIPALCPVLNTPLITGLGPHNPNNPSVDRMTPKLGYVKGNVCVISLRANTLKRDVTDPEELLRVYRYVVKCQHKTRAPKS